MGNLIEKEKRVSVENGGSLIDSFLFGTVRPSVEGIRFITRPGLPLDNSNSGKVVSQRTESVFKHHNVIIKVKGHRLQVQDFT